MKRTLWALPAVLSAVSMLHATDIAYTDPNNGNEVVNGNLALTFNVNSAIEVDALGLFNSSGSGLIAAPLTVGIYDTSSNTLLTSAVFSGQYTPAGLGFDVFQAITPVVLQPGSYEVDAVGFDFNDEAGNFNISGVGPTLDNGGGLLTFTGAAYDGSATLDDPLSCAGCQSAPSPQNIQFDAGTFQFQAATATPEPSTLILAGLGLAAVIVRRRTASDSRR